ncbi:hypothetical protein Efla_003930 [Eimeria flavescens]
MTYCGAYGDQPVFSVAREKAADVMGVAGVVAYRWLPRLFAAFPLIFPSKRVFFPFTLCSRPMSSPAVHPNFLPGADREAPQDSLIVGAGCFWGVEKLFRNNFASKLISTQVGYAGGTKENPTYEEVCRGTTGHFEAVKLCYYKDKTKPEELLEFFWTIHDPTTKDRSAEFACMQQQRKILLLNLLNQWLNAEYMQGSFLQDCTGSHKKKNSRI